MTEPCPTCGSPVRVVSGEEGTSHYVPVNDALRSALERCRANFVLAVNGKPVRDMAETLAEVDAALREAERGTG